MPDLPTQPLSPPDRTADLPAGGTADLTGAATDGPASSAEPAACRLVAPAADPPPPRAAGRYVLGDEIARGGMGVVCRATDTVLGREVAVKVLQDRFGAGSHAARRFADEARITARLQHPGIPPVHDLGALPDGRPFLAMKLIRGQTLEDRIRAADDRGRLVAAFEGVCQAVGFAHAKGVVHRDLKPANVMVGSFGEVQVMDWGLAKVSGAGRDGDPAAPAADPPDGAGPVIGPARDSGDVTRTGSVLGTPAYMPPEQAAGLVDEVDARSDVFGLGAVLCAVLTGRPPYQAAAAGSTRQLAARAELGGAFARLDASGADPELIALCKRCLAPEKADRPADAGEVAKAVAGLRAAADDRARAAEREKHAAEVRAAEEGKRRRVLVTLGSAVLVTLLAGGGVAGWQWWRATDARRDADTQAEAARQKAAAATAAKEFLQSVLVQTDPFDERVKNRTPDPNLPLRAALDRAAGEIAGKFADQPEIEADLRATIGRAYRGLGAYPAAGPHLEAALALREGRFGPDHPDTLGSVLDLAKLDADRGDYPAAEPRLRRVLAGRERALGPDHPDVFKTVADLANLSLRRGDYPTAADLYRRAVAGLEAARGPGHPDTLAVVGQLATVCLFQGDRGAAEELHRRAVAGLEAARGPGHPDTLAAVFGLSQVYRARGDLSAAEPLLKRALVGYEKALGPDHRSSLSAANDLALVYLDRLDYAAAEPLFERVVAGYERRLGPGHEDTLTAINNLAWSYMDRGDLEAAGPLFRRVLSGSGAALGPDHLYAVTACGNLAELEMRRGDYAASDRWARDALARAERGFGPDHPHTLAAAAGVGASAVAGGRPAEAVAPLERACRGWRDHPGTVDAACDLMDAYADAGRPADAARLAREAVAAVRPGLPAGSLGLSRLLATAGHHLTPTDPAAAEPLLRESLAIRAKEIPDDWRTSGARLLLGKALLRQRKWTEAEPLLLDGYRGMKDREVKLPPLARDRLPEAADRLIEVYRTLGKPDEVAKWRAERATYSPDRAPPPREVGR